MMLGSKKNFDIIIIGAGMGGIVAGAILAKHGKDVLIIEKNSFCGGYASSFHADGFTFDRGIIHLSGVMKNGVLHNVFRELGIENDVKLCRLNPFAKVLSRNYEIEISADREYVQQQLIDIFPDERKNIICFFDDCASLLEEMRQVFNINRIQMDKFPTIAKYRFQTITQIIQSLFQNYDLQQFFLAQSFFLSGPDEAIMLAGLLTGSALIGDVYYPEGGMQTLSDAIIKVFKNAGGDLLLKHKVDKILMDGNQVEGVIVAGERIRSKFIVADTDAFQLYTQMIEETAATKKHIAMMKKNVIGRSSYIVYLGVDMPLDDYHHYMSFLPDYEPAGQFDSKKRGINIFIPSLLNSLLAPSGMHTVIAGMQTPYGYWINDDHEEDTKKRIKQDIIASVEKVIPGISEHIVYESCNSPKDWQQLTLNCLGSNIGWANTPVNIIRRWSNKTPIEGLYHVGHWSGPWSGVIGTSKYGMEVAYALLNQFT